MFAVLNVTPWEKSIKGKLKERYSKPYIKTEKQHLSNGSFFYNIETKPHKGSLPFEELNSLKLSFLLPFDKETDRIKKYEEKDFSKKLLFNTALRYIKNENINPYNSCITLFDENGIHTKETEKLCRLASRVVVVTNETERYKREEKRLMENYGISLVISCNFENSFLKSDYIISPNADDISPIYGGTVLSLNKKQLLNGRVLTCGGITLPIEYALLWDKKISKLAFASALCEKCKVKELEELCFDEICL